MQVKKKEVQNAIVEAAKAEFLEYGFDGSSMRRMASRANTGMSNFYNYFRSKEDIFAFIVEDHAKAITALFARLSQEDSVAAFKDIKEYKTLLHNLRRWASRFDILYNKETLLLFTSSKGTLFESVRRNITDGMTNAVMRLSSWDPSVKLPEQYPIRLFVSQLLEDMISTSKIYASNPKLKDILRNQLVTSVAGFFVMLN